MSFPSCTINRLEFSNIKPLTINTNLPATVVSKAPASMATLTNAREIAWTIAKTDYTKRRCAQNL